MELLKRQLIMLPTIKKEHFAIILALLFFLQYPGLSRLLDASAAPIDPGALSAIILAVLGVLLFKSITWWLIENIWPVLATYSREQFENNFNSLLPWQKVCIYLSFYLLLLYSFLAALGSLI